MQVTLCYNGLLRTCFVPHQAYKSKYTTMCESMTQWLDCSAEKWKINSKRGCRCLCWRNMGFGDRSQYMLVAVPLAVRMLSWMWQTQWPFFCVLKADAVSGLAPDFLLRVPAQSILLCASLKTNLYLCGLQEILTAANLCVHPSQSHWKWAASQDKHSDGIFFFKTQFCQSKWENYPMLKRKTTKTSRTSYVPAVKFQ